MGWLIATIVVLFFVWLLVVSPWFRRFAVVVVVVIGIGIWWFVSKQEEKARLAAERIKPTEIELTDLSMWNSYGTSYQVGGKVRNLSPHYTVSRITLKISAYDCPGDEITPQCDVIGDQTVSAYLGVPPGQVRSLDEYVYFSNMPASVRNFRWSYYLADVEARVD